MREKNAKLNITFSLYTQIVAAICGLIVPRLILKAFGSEAYGAMSSITQFLSYIVLLEGGIGGVARSVLYKPLAEKDIDTVSEIVDEMSRFFRAVALFFLLYVLLLAVSFKSISHVESLDWATTFLLVIAISISTFAQYYIGITYAILLNASQKNYIVSGINIIATVLNTLLIIILLHFNASIVIVKLVSSVVFALKPFALWIIVKKILQIKKVKYRGNTYLSQKWTGLGQHIAYFLHTNTDVVVLTLFANLKLVAVYSVFNMVISHIKSFCLSFTDGMEPLFGDMLAKEEMETLNRSFGLYETLISITSNVLFSSTIVLICPFVQIYTNGINDTNYNQPIFAILICFAWLFYLFMQPYHSVVIAAGHFRQTKWSAYGEAIINVILSIVLVKKYGLIGVAIGTIVATLFRFLYYVLYLSKHILMRDIKLFVKRLCINMLSFIIVILIGNLIVNNADIKNYGIWAIFGIIIFVISFTINLIIYFFSYKDDLESILKRFLKPFKKQ